MIKEMDTGIIENWVSMRLLNAHRIGRDPSFAQHAGQLSRCRDSRSSGLAGGGAAWFIQSNGRKQTWNACGLQCIPVCILNLGYLPVPDQISSVIVAGPVRSHAHNLSTWSSTNLSLGGPTCENQAADIPRSREFSNKSGIKMRFLCTPMDRVQCRGHRRAGDRRRGK